MTINLIKVDGSWCLRPTCLLLVQNNPNYSEKTFFRCSLVWNLTLMLGFTIIMLQARWSIGALTNKQSDKLLWKIPRFVAALGSLCVARQGHERHHQGFVPSSGKNLPDHPQPCGTRHPPRHRGSLGQRRFGYSAKIFRLYRQQYQGKTHEFGVHRPYRWQIVLAVKVFGSCEFLRKL